MWPPASAGCLDPAAKELPSVPVANGELPRAPWDAPSRDPPSAADPCCAAAAPQTGPAELDGMVGIGGPELVRLLAVTDPAAGTEHIEPPASGKPDLDAPASDSRSAATRWLEVSDAKVPWEAGRLSASADSGPRPEVASCAGRLGGWITPETRLLEASSPGMSAGVCARGGGAPIRAASASDSNAPTARDPLAERTCSWNSWYGMSEDLRLFCTHISHGMCSAMSTTVACWALLAALLGSFPEAAAPLASTAVACPRLRGAWLCSFLAASSNEDAASRCWGEVAASLAFRL